MFGCFRVRGLLAASAYGDLTDRERRTLEKHVAKCAACRAEEVALTRLVSQIPADDLPADCDLMPSLRRRLAESETAAAGNAWKLAFFGAACVMVFGLFATVVWKQLPTATPGQQVSHVEEPGTLSPVGTVLEEASALMEVRDYPRAYQVLQEVVETHPDDALAGEAQRLLAEIAFGHLRWYRQADKAYETLARKYKAAYDASPDLGEVVARRELLAEARKDSYRSLEAFDAARHGLGDRFKKLEDLLAQYPGSYIASLAAEELARLVAEETGSPEDAQTWMAAMETARNRCTNPLAIAQLNLEMGHIWRDRLNNPARARELYVEAAKTDSQALARLARDSLKEVSDPARALPNP